MKITLAALVLVALLAMAAATQTSQNVHSSEHLSPFSDAPEAESPQIIVPESIPHAGSPQSEPQSAPAPAGGVITPSDGKILFGVFLDTNCQSALFTSEFDNNFDLCQSVTVQSITASFHIGCMNNMTLVGVSYPIGSSGCSGTESQFPLAPSGSCVQIPSTNGAQSIRGFCPGDPNANPPTMPPPPSGNASSLVASIVLIVLALFGTFIF